MFGARTLIEAIKDSDLNSVMMCLKGGENPNSCTRLGLSSLHVAAVSGEVDIVESLIQYGGDVNKLTGWGSSVLHLAAHRGSLSIVALLLKYGATVNIADDNNDTPLHLACVEDHLEVVRLLLKAGAERTIRNNAGKSAVDECNDSDVSADLLKILNTTFPDRYDNVPPLIQDNHALLNQTEFVPDFDVPTDESYSSIINEFSLNENTKPANLVQSYTGTKSINDAQRFSFLAPKNDANLPASFNTSNSSTSKLVLDQSIDLSQPSCSLSQMLNFQNMPTGNSIDSSVYRETYQLFHQINPGNVYPSNSFQSNPSISNIRNNHFSDSSALFSGSQLRSLASFEESLTSQHSGFPHSAETTASAGGIACSNVLTPVPSVTEVDQLVESLAPVLETAEDAAARESIGNIAANVLPPWPVEGIITGMSSGEWVYGEDYVLISNTPLNAQNFEEREGSCSLVFKILHQHYGPLVLKMMVNLLNQTDHDSGQSGTLFLKKQFSAEHSVPISIPYHPNVVQMLHSYNGSTGPFKRYLPLLVPEGLDVDIDMASRTSFLAMREFPFSLKNFVNKFVEHKVKLCLLAKTRIKEELRLVLLLLLQCLFALQHLAVSKVVHRDIKLDNFMMRHSGQVILIDFGWAVNLYNPDGTPALAMEKNDIIAGNSVAWAPEISQAHNKFEGPIFYTDVYGSSDLNALAKTFVSVFEVFGFLEKNSDGGIQCPSGLDDLPVLINVVSLLHQMSRDDPAERIDVSSAITFLGSLLFFQDCTTVPEVLAKYIKISLCPLPSQHPSIADIESLGTLPYLHTAVSKQFVTSVQVDGVIGQCLTRAAGTEF